MPFCLFISALLLVVLACCRLACVMRPDLGSAVLAVLSLLALLSAVLLGFPEGKTVALLLSGLTAALLAGMLPD